MTMIGMVLCAGSFRTIETSFRPSMIGMLMSVRIRSILFCESFLSASMPSLASTTLLPGMRFNANEMSCRMVGESSTTRNVYSGMVPFPPLFFLQQVQEALDRRELALRLGVQLRGEERR